MLYLKIKRYRSAAYFLIERSPFNLTRILNKDIVLLGMVSLNYLKGISKSPNGRKPAFSKKFGLVSDKLNLAKISCLLLYLVGMLFTVNIPEI